MNLVSVYLLLEYDRLEHIITDLINSQVGISHSADVLLLEFRLKLRFFLAVALCTIAVQKNPRKDSHSENDSMQNDCHSFMSFTHSSFRLFLCARISTVDLLDQQQLKIN